MSIFVKKSTIFGFFLLLLVALIMHLVMDVALDRKNYLYHYENPFDRSRLEVGFVFFIQALHILQIPPALGIILTTLIIYAGLFAFWIKQNTSPNWIISILIFNGLMFSLFNYYLGTSIRMGMAISLALLFVYLAKYRRLMLLPLLLTPLVHYGVVYFVVTYLWIVSFKSRSPIFHVISIFAQTLLLIAVFDFVLPRLGLGDYYMMYFTDSFGATKRIFPLSLLAYISILIIIVFKFKKFFIADRQLALLSIYGFPFLMFYTLTGYSLLGKMIMPNIFISVLIVMKLYAPRFIFGTGQQVYFLLLVLFNFLSIVYAMKMYNFL